MNKLNLFNCPFDSNGNRKAFLLPMKVTSENLHAYEASGWLTTTNENKNPPIDKWCIIDPSVETIVKLKGLNINDKSIIQKMLEDAQSEEEIIIESLKNDVSFEAIGKRRDARKKRELIQKEFFGSK